MQGWRVAVMTALGCLLVAGTAATASDDVDPTDPNVRRDEVVALVLAQDARFTSLPAYRRQEIESSSVFSLDPIIGSSYYRVLPTATTRWSDYVGMDLFAFREPRNWLVEVVLVRDCLPMATGTVVEPLPDPCAWRHAWYYRVESDDTVTLLFEEGDPDPMPTG